MARSSATGEADAVGAATARSAVMTAEAKSVRAVRTADVPFNYCEGDTASAFCIAEAICLTVGRRALKHHSGAPLGNAEMRSPGGLGAKLTLWGERSAAPGFRPHSARHFFDAPSTGAALCHHGRAAPHRTGCPAGSRPGQVRRASLLAPPPAPHGDHSCRTTSLSTTASSRACIPHHAPDAPFLTPENPEAGSGGVSTESGVTGSRAGVRTPGSWTAPRAGRGASASVPSSSPVARDRPSPPLHPRPENGPY